MRVLGLPTIRRGLRAGLETTWALGKIIFPITVFITVLSYTPLLNWLARAVSPFLHLFGLPGEAAIVLVLGNFLNLYAAIGAMLSMELTVKQVFILALMLSFSHNLLIESTVAARVGLKIWIVVLVRISLAFISGWLVSVIWKGGNQMAQSASGQHTEQPPAGFIEILGEGLFTAAVGVLQLAAIVIPLMIFIQLLRDVGWIETFSRWLAPFTRLLGMKPNTSTTLVSGLVFGLAFGAGVMIQAAKEDRVEKKDLYLAFIFLVSCHSFIEDSAVFIPFGIPVLALLFIRLLTALLLTGIIAFIWNKIVPPERKELSYES